MKVLLFLLLILNTFHFFSPVSVVYFEQVNIWRDSNNTNNIELNNKISGLLIIWVDPYYFIVVIQLYYKETLAQVFSCEVCEICEISGNTFFTEQLWATASFSFENLLKVKGSVADI